jgi:tRNA(Ile)-lysidine synthase
MSGAGDAAGAGPIVGTGLAERLDRHLRSTGLLPRGSGVTVALSGGLDSVALLSLLVGLAERWRWRLSAAHFDHRMRQGSAAEAEWVAALCKERGVPCRIGRASVVPSNEAEARDLRYDFLERARAELEADWVATAHHADDQAETVMFRLLRGSGLTGLAGIRPRRARRVVRPLLPFWRAEVEEYARAHGLPYLDDPSNLDLRIERNRLRHVVIPGLEAAGWCGLRSELCRLGDLARRADEWLERASDRVLRGLVLEASERRIVVARTPFLAYDNRVRAQLVRILAGRVGARPGRVGTRLALEFISRCGSGRRIELAGGVVISREFDRLIFAYRPSDGPGGDEELAIGDLRGGVGRARIAGVWWRVRWRLERSGRGGPREVGAPGGEVACFDAAELRPPLTVRSWRPGDRIRLAAGTRKLKKVFVDRRVGRSERGAYPLLADGAGVLWVVGLVRGVRAAVPGVEVLAVGFEREG